MTDAGKVEKRGRPKGSPNRTDHDRLKELALEYERVELREEQRLINIARQEGYFDLRYRNEEIAELFRRDRNAKTVRKASTLKKLSQKLALLRHGTRRGETRRKVLLGAFLTAQCRHDPEFHAACVPDLRQWLRTADDPAVAKRNSEALKEWLRHPGTVSDDPGTKSPEAEHRAHNHRMILLGAWVQSRREAFPGLAERIGTQLRGFIEADPMTADRNRKLLADLI